MEVPKINTPDDAMEYVERGEFPPTSAQRIDPEDTPVEPSPDENGRIAQRRVSELEAHIGAELDLLAERLRQQEITGYLLIVTVLCLTVLLYELSRERQ